MLVGNNSRCCQPYNLSGCCRSGLPRSIRSIVMVGCITSFTTLFPDGESENRAFGAANKIPLQFHISCIELCHSGVCSMVTASYPNINILRERQKCPFSPTLESTIAAPIYAVAHASVLANSQAITNHQSHCIWPRAACPQPVAFPHRICHGLRVGNVHLGLA